MTALQQAQAGLDNIKTAIIAYLNLHPEGASNAEIAEALKLHSDYEGEQKDYLSWSILGLLVNDGLIRYERRNRRRIYFPVKT